MSNKINFLYLKLLLIFLLLLLMSKFSFAENNHLNYKFFFKQSVYKEQFKRTIENSLLIIDKNSSSKISQVKVYVNFKNNINYSYSNADNKNCVININYKDLNPVFLSTIEEDFMFIFFHELNHCILGKENLYSTSFPWKLDLTNKVRNDLNIEIETLNNRAFSNIICIKCKNKKFKMAPPIIVYSEIYADIQALIWLFNENKSLDSIYQVEDYRTKEFNKNSISNYYGSMFATPILLDYLDEIKDYKNTALGEQISQKGFVDYLLFIKEYYYH